MSSSSFGRQFKSSALLSLSQAELEVVCFVKMFDSTGNSTVSAESLDDYEAQGLLDTLQYMLDIARSGFEHHLPPMDLTVAVFRRRAIRLLVKLTKYHNTLPTALFVTGITCYNTLDPLFRGGYSDVFQGQHVSGSVALKRLRTYMHARERDEINQNVCREAAFWRQLDHPNLIPFLGVDRHTFAPLFALVSPWMARGNLVEFIRTEKVSDSQIDELLAGAARGLAYLHDQGIVHGDVRAANILINDERDACLTDFGLMRVTSTTSGSISTTGHGNIRWLSPGCINDTEEIGLPSDVFAFGRVCLEACTLKHPFHYVVLEATVAVHIARSTPIARPQQNECEGRVLSDGLWEVMQHCWDDEASARLTAVQVSEALLKLTYSTSSGNATAYSSPAGNSAASSASVWHASTEYLIASSSAAVHLQYPESQGVGHSDDVLHDEPLSETSPIPEEEEDAGWVVVPSKAEKSRDDTIKAAPSNRRSPVRFFAPLSNASHEDHPSDHFPFEFRRSRPSSMVQTHQGRRSPLQFDLLFAQAGNDCQSHRSSIDSLGLGRDAPPIPFRRSSSEFQQPFLVSDARSRRPERGRKHSFGAPNYRLSRGSSVLGPVSAASRPRISSRRSSLLSTAFPSRPPSRLDSEESDTVFNKSTAKENQSPVDMFPGITAPSDDNYEHDLLGASNCSGHSNGSSPGVLHDQDMADLPEPQVSAEHDTAPGYARGPSLKDVSSTTASLESPAVLILGELDAATPVEETTDSGDYDMWTLSSLAILREAQEYSSSEDDSDIEVEDKYRHQHYRHMSEDPPQVVLPLRAKGAARAQTLPCRSLRRQPHFTPSQLRKRPKVTLQHFQPPLLRVSTSDGPETIS